MDAVTELLIDVLAATRITRLVVEDTFPPVKALRDRIVANHSHERSTFQKVLDDDGTTNVVQIGHHTEYDSVAELITCPWCAGFWVCMLVVLARRVAPGLWAPLAKAFAFSMVAGLIESKVDVD